MSNELDIAEIKRFLEIENTTEGMTHHECTIAYCHLIGAIKAQIKYHGPKTDNIELVHMINRANAVGLEHGGKSHE